MTCYDRRAVNPSKGIHDELYPDARSTLPRMHNYRPIWSTNDGVCTDNVLPAPFSRVGAGAYYINEKRLPSIDAFRFLDACKRGFQRKLNAQSIRYHEIVCR